MVGTYGDVVLAEAVVKGVLTGDDAQKAWSALRRDAYEEAPPGGAVGKVGLRVYEQHGYIPDDSGVSDCVSRTLDFAHADWCGPSVEIDVVAATPSTRPPRAGPRREQGRLH